MDTNNLTEKDWSRLLRVIKSACFKVSQDAEEGEEMVGEACVKVMETIGDWDPEKGRSLTSWVFKSAENAAWNVARKKMRRRKSAPVYFLTEEIEGESLEGSWAKEIYNRPTPEGDYLLRLAIQKVLYDKKEYYDYFREVYLTNPPVSEIAENRGIARKTVMRKSQLAMQDILKRFDEIEDVDLEPARMIFREEEGLHSN